MSRARYITTAFVLLILLMTTTIQGSEETIPWPDRIQDIDTVNGWLFDLVDRYPGLLSVSIIGYSTDERPVYALRLTDESLPAVGEEGIELKKRFLLEAGTHAREVANPYYVLKMVELYCMDFEDESVIPEYSMRSILRQAVIHVVPMSNPDGYAYAVSGKPSIRSEELLNNMLHIYEPSSHEWYKANLNGVDLNRNYPAVYYDAATDSWKDIFGMPNDQQSFIPSSMYYAGKEAASEIETRVLKAYVDQYDFRALVNYHSKGRLVLWGRWMLSPSFNSYVKPIAEAMAAESDYELGEMAVVASGYLSDYFAMTKLRPAITVETGTYYFDQDLRSEFERVKLLPLIAFTEVLKEPYGRYRVYVEGAYYSDYRDSVYAEAFAEKLGGVVVEGDGEPEAYYTRFPKALEAVAQAGIDIGGDDGLMPGRIMTRSEAVVMLARAVPLLKEAVLAESQLPLFNWQLIYRPLIYRPLPIDDMPSWTKEAVESLGLKQAVTRNQFLSFLLRMLGYVEGEDFRYDHSDAYALRLGLLTQDEMDALHKESLLREEAAMLVYRVIMRRYL